MTNSNPSRRRFLQLTSGGLLISTSLTATGAAESTSLPGPKPNAGDVLPTRGTLSENGQSLVEAARTIPVAGSSDVLICGGGPAGVAAALSAARVGASVQLIEVAGCLGGVWTAGLLTKILDSENKSGIMAELLIAALALPLWLWLDDGLDGGRSGQSGCCTNGRGC